MKILLIILIIGIIFIGVAGAVAFSLIDNDFTEKVLSISTDKICEIESLSNVFVSKCNKNTPKEIDISQSNILITKNPKTGVIKVKSK